MTGISKLYRVFSLCLIICSSCAKEIILKDDIVIDDKIFCVAYCSNDSNKNGLRIYGHELEAKQIKAWIWYKNKYTSLEFSFKNDIDDITYYYTDLKGFVFNAK